MNLIFLTRVTGFFKPFAYIMGVILNAIYKLVAAIGFQNIAICIVVFTIVVKMLMLPLTIKQQKFAKVSAKMNPEIQAISEKYKGYDRRDRDVMTKMTEEQQDVYRKYGVSAFTGCLPILIMFPVIIALYKVVYAIPAYVTPVKDLYQDVAESVINLDKADPEMTDEFITEAIRQFYQAEGITPREKKDKIEEFDSTDLIDIYTVFTTKAWDDFRNGRTLEPIKDKDGKITQDVDKWNTLAKSISFNTAMQEQDKNVDKIIDINGLFGKYSILDAPGFKFPGIIIPLLAMVLQFLCGKVSQIQNDKQSGGDEGTLGGSMKVMNTILPVMSGVFCVYMPIGVGIYWIVNSGVQLVQQICINKYFDKYDIDEIVSKNEEKIRERNEKLGVYTKSNQMNQIASKSTRSIATMNTSSKSEKNKNSETKSVHTNGTVSAKKKDKLAKMAAEKEGGVGIAAIANLLNNDDEEDE